MTATLTDRYIAETVKSLPPQLQAEVRDELHASIADAIDARTEHGEARERAERDVLNDLGDPGALAAGFADRPLHLIGPKYYLTWWRLLKLLIIIIPACALGGAAIAQAVDGASIGEVIGRAIPVAISVMVHVAFWTTLVFVILERAGADTGTEWDVDQLPAEPHAGTGRADMIASLVLLGLFAGLLVWDQVIGIVTSGAAPLPLLNPVLWPWGIGALLLLLVARAVLALAVYARGHWTSLFVWTNAAIALCVICLGLTALGSGVLFSPDFEALLAGNGVDADARSVLAVIAGVGIVGFCIWDAVDAWLKARRAALRA